jgi:hypothetical protein
MGLFATTYQIIFFPVYRILKVRRSDHLVFDRTDFPYPNIIKKLNCFYCAYHNIDAAYAPEVVARTEQYWCPIKHAPHIHSTHGCYPSFFDYGDAEAYSQESARLRRQYSDCDCDSGAPVTVTGQGRSAPFPQRSSHLVCNMQRTEKLPRRSMRLEYQSRIPDSQFFSL